MMVELRHSIETIGSSLAVVAMALGLTSAFNKAEAMPSILMQLAERTSVRAQGNENTNRPDTIPPSSDAAGQVDDDVPFSELNEALTEARSRLAELTKAAEIAKVAGELRKELEATRAINRNLEASLSQAGDENAKLQTSYQAITRQAEAAQQAASEASEEARRLDEELVAVRWQNSQLSTSLKRAEAAASENAKKFEASNSELREKVETLASDLERKVAEITGLKSEVDATRKSAEIAEQRGAELEEQLAQGQTRADAAEAEAAKLARDLDVTITELGGARSELVNSQKSLEEMGIALAAAEQEQAVLREQITVNRGEADLLRQRLEAAEAQVEQVNAVNGSLKQQVESLRIAAGEATDAARLNLVAVNNQINEINAALAAAKGNELLAPSGGPANEENIAAAETVSNPGERSPSNTAVSSDIWVPDLTPARATAIGSAQRQLVASNTAAFPAPRKAANPPPASSPLANRVTRIGQDAQRPAEATPTSAATLIAGVSDDEKRSTEDLLSDLNVRTEPRGLTMTVPGTILFAVNSEKIEPEAYETLAKVAEVVQLYRDRQVLVIGHTDAVGDDGYNQQLSERRAELVKDYFVGEFGIERGRFSVEGQGETRPIASNATAEGRDTNRRVEVVVLNQ